MPTNTVRKFVPYDDLESAAPDEGTYIERFTASVKAGIADADAGRILGTAELRAWLAQRRSQRKSR